MGERDMCLLVRSSMVWVIFRSVSPDTNQHIRARIWLPAPFESRCNIHNISSVVHVLGFFLLFFFRTQVVM